ncbi:MAG: DUF642 domain-containing protein [Pseudomonadota bacterium]
MSFGSNDFARRFGGTVSGWTVIGSGIDWLSESRFGADDGQLSVDLQSNSPGGVFINIPTVTGETYEISFAAAAPSSFASGGNAGTVNAGDLNQVFTTTVGGSLAAPNWEQFSFNFLAQATSTRITFTANAQNGIGFGPVIDDVSVVLAQSQNSSQVPAPAPVLLLGLGLVLSGLIRRRSGGRLHR